MNTPRRRLTRAGMAKSGGIMSPKSTSTPTSASRASRSSINRSESPTNFMGEDDIMPCSQAMVNPKTGVYWNYEASPSVKAELKRLMSADSDDEEIPSPAPITPVIKFRIRSRRTSESPPKLDQEQLEALESMREICAKIMANKESQEAPEPLAKTPPETGDKTPPKDDLFGDDSTDDSFLIRCTQAAEDEAFKKPENEPKAPSRFAFKPTQVIPKKVIPPVVRKSPSNSGFDDDDDFDLMLSQMDIPTVSQPSVKSAQLLKKVAQSPKNPTTVAKKAKPDPTGGWRRVYSSPEATTTSGALLPNKNVKQRHQTVSGGRCSKAEIERKRQEAIKRRSQKQK